MKGEPNLSKIDLFFGRRDTASMQLVQNEIEFGANVLPLEYNHSFLFISQFPNFRFGMFKSQLVIVCVFRVKLV